MAQTRVPAAPVMPTGTPAYRPTATSAASVIARHGEPRTSLTHPINISWVFPPDSAGPVAAPGEAGLDMLDVLRRELEGQRRRTIAAAGSSTDRPSTADSQKTMTNGTPAETPSALSSTAAVSVAPDESNHGREEVEEVEAGLRPSEGIIIAEGDEQPLVSISDSAGPSENLAATNGSAAKPSPPEWTTPSPYGGVLKYPGTKHGNFALSSCPGKKVRLSTGPVNGRAMINRDLDHDFERLASAGITMVVCCLGDEELEYLGAPWPKYSAAAVRKKIDIVRIPIVEGQCPQTMGELETVLIKIDERVRSGAHVLSHCRGGIGRAGLVACCFLLRNGYLSTADRAIQFVRMRRSPKAIETIMQEDYIRRYEEWIKKQRRGVGDKEEAGSEPK
ncbi:protein-tyrosine phosphatase-like protein [Cladochytrium replicatum]|nr:protein-tyrosine phosphatase-like protein [Cladochytrium replicatum]